MSIDELRSRALAEFVAPDGRDRFLAERWDRAPLVRTGAPERFRHLASLADADRLLARDPRRVLIEHTAAEFGNEPADHAGPADVDRALLHFEGGATLMLDEVERRLEPVAGLCRMLTADLGFRCTGALSVTPPGGYAAEPHFDTVGQFILQIAGRRTWTLGPAAANRPSPPASRVAVGLAPEVAEAALGPGDMLYLPRGWPHALAAASESSLHLAVMIHAPTWRDAIAAAGENGDGLGLGELVPVGWWRMPREALAAELGRRWPGCPDAATAENVVDLLRTREIRGFPVDMAGRLSALVGPAPVAAETLFGARPDVMWDLTAAVRTARLISGPLTLDFPAAAAPALRHCLSEDSYTVADLPTRLGTRARLDLLGRLAAMRLIQRFDRQAEPAPG